LKYFLSEGTRGLAPLLRKTGTARHNCFYFCDNFGLR